MAAVIDRYSRPAMARIWSDEGKLETWLEGELAALHCWVEVGAVPAGGRGADEGWVEVGAVPADDVAAIEAGASSPDPARVREIEATLHHDTAAFVDAVAEQ